MSGDPYTYPDTTVLRNRLDIHEAKELDRVERRHVTQRTREGIPPGSFDLAHLRAIHRHLFQDVYPWAGELRTVEISKGGHQFQFRRYIETGMADIHRRLAGSQFLQGTTPEQFADKAGPIMGDVNYVHPFREGNGRAQLQYLKQLAEQAGHALDLKQIQPDAWQTASREAHLGQYEAMTRSIAGAIAGRDRSYQTPAEIRAAMKAQSKAGTLPDDPSLDDNHTRGRGRSRTR